LKKKKQEIKPLLRQKYDKGTKIFPSFCRKTHFRDENSILKNENTATFQLLYLGLRDGALFNFQGLH